MTHETSTAGGWKAGPPTWLSLDALARRIVAEGYGDTIVGWSEGDRLSVGVQQPGHAVAHHELDGSEWRAALLAALTGRELGTEPEAEPAEPLGEILARVQPTMRATVALMRALGLRTTDSGDGVTNPAAGMDDALQVPHVFGLVEPAKANAIADRIQAVLAGLGCRKPDGEPLDVEAYYSASDHQTVLAVLGLDDQRLSPSARSVAEGFIARATGGG